MKKILYVLLTLVMVFALASCGNKLPATADVESAEDIPVETVADDASDASDDSGDSAAFSCDGEAIVPNGGYTCVDRFSREQIGANVLYVHDSDSTKVVFNYICSQGSFYELTAYLNSAQEATVYLTDTLSLEMKFDQSTVYVDELEGMGAMAYDYIHY